MRRSSVIKSEVGGGIAPFPAFGQDLYRSELSWITLLDWMRRRTQLCLLDRASQRNLDENADLRNELRRKSAVGSRFVVRSVDRVILRRLSELGSYPSSVEWILGNE